MTDSAPSPEIFRSHFNVFAGVALWLLCGAAVVAVLLTFARASTLVYLAPIAVVALLVWMVLWRPIVRVDDRGVRLVNVTRTIDVPWAALIQVDTRYSLSLRTPHGRYAATAAPAPGRVNVAFGRSELPPSARLDGPARPGDSTGTDSGAAAQLVRDRWTRLTDAGRIELGAAETTPVQVSWHWTSLALLAILVTGSLVALALG